MSMLRATLLSFRVGLDVVKTEGMLTLMKGSNIFALKRVFDWSTRYFFADLFELAIQTFQNGRHLSVGQRSVASLLGGVASTCTTLPLDVLGSSHSDEPEPLRLIPKQILQLPKCRTQRKLGLRSPHLSYSWTSYERRGSMVCEMHTYEGLQHASCMCA